MIENIARKIGRQIGRIDTIMNYYTPEKLRELYGGSRIWGERDDLRPQADACFDKWETTGSGGRLPGAWENLKQDARERGWPDQNPELQAAVSVVLGLSAIFLAKIVDRFPSTREKFINLLAAPLMFSSGHVHTRYESVHDPGTPVKQFE